MTRTTNPSESLLEKKKERARIDTELALFIANGGQIEHIRFGVGSFEYTKSQRSIWKKNRAVSQ